MEQNLRQISDPTSHKSFMVIKNDLTTNDLSKLQALTNLKNFYSRLIPNMPRYYLALLLFDGIHENFVLYNRGKLIAAVTFRGFDAKHFCEIPFMAVSQQKQCEGLGSELMNKLKAILQKRKITRAFVFADDLAVDFFKRHGFRQHIQMPSQKWEKYIKMYKGGKILECSIDPHIDYSNLKAKLELQKRHLIEAAKTELYQDGLKRSISSASTIISNFTAQNPEDKNKSLKLIPGVKECGFQLNSIQNRESLSIDLLAEGQKLLKTLSSYFQVCSFPQQVKLKLRELLMFAEQKLANGEYKAKVQLKEEVEFYLFRILKYSSTTSRQRNQRFIELFESFLQKNQPVILREWKSPSYS